jgi:hypothetical protein
MGSFNHFLDSVLKSKFTRSQLLVKLQLEYTEFSGLDAITLSRWTNGVTQPSLYKQLLIAHAVDCLDTYLSQCRAPAVPKVMENHFAKYTSQFSQPYHLIWSPRDQEVIRFKSGLAKELREIYQYILKIDILSDLSNHLDSINSGHKVNVFYVGGEHNAESCIYFHDQVLESFKSININSEKIEQMDVSNVLSFGLAYFKSALHCEILLGLSLNYVIRHHFNRDNVLFTARGRASMDFFESIGAQLYASAPEKNNLGNIYIYHMALKKVCGNPKFFNLIKKYQGLYDQVILSENGIAMGDI